jgi:hypothetical protein
MDTFAGSTNHTRREGAPAREHPTSDPGRERREQALRPQWGLLILVALAPFHGLLLIAPLPGFVSGWKEGLVVLTLAATFVAPASARRSLDRPAPRWLPALAGLLLLAIAWVPFVEPEQAWFGLKIGFFYVLVAVTAWRCPLDRTERDRLVTILMVVACITSVFGLAQQAIGGDRLHDLGWEWNTTIRTAGGFLRSFSTFNQPFPFAFTLVAATLVCLPVALRDPGRRRNRLFLLSLPLVTLGLAVSIVRTAWLALLVGLVFLAVHRYRELVPWLVLGAVAFGVGLLSVPTDAFGAATSPASFEDRTSAWTDNLAQLSQAPVGIGLGTTGSAGEAARTSTLDPEFTRLQLEVDGNAYQPDSQFYKMGLEFGVLGLWLFVLLLASACASAWRLSRRRSGSDSDLAAGIAASIAAAAVASATSTYLEIFPLDVLFWLLLGVMASLDDPRSV